MIEMLLFVCFVMPMAYIQLQPSPKKHIFFRSLLCLLKIYIQPIMIIICIHRLNCVAKMLFFFLAPRLSCCQLWIVSHDHFFPLHSYSKLIIFKYSWLLFTWVESSLNWFRLGRIRFITRSKMYSRRFKMSFTSFDVCDLNWICVTSGDKFIAIETRTIWIQIFSFLI